MVPHTVIVDFATALLITSVACELLSLVAGERDLRTVGFWTLLLGTPAVALSVLSGFAAAWHLDQQGLVGATVALHRNFGLASVACFGVCAVWRLSQRGALPKRLQSLYWLLTFAGLVAIVLTAYYGGYLVFRLGVGVTPSA